MHKYFGLSAGCLLAAGLISAATAADWEHRYIYRETNGSWTNVEFNDGTCHYYYSFNSYDQNLIGPDGVARPVYMAPVRRVVPVR